MSAACLAAAGIPGRALPVSLGLQRQAATNGHSSVLPSFPVHGLKASRRQGRLTMRFGSTAKVLLECKLKYYRISECTWTMSPDHPFARAASHSRRARARRCSAASSFVRNLNQTTGSSWHTACLDPLPDPACPAPAPLPLGAGSSSPAGLSGTGTSAGRTPHPEGLE